MTDEIGEITIGRANPDHWRQGDPTPLLNSALAKAQGAMLAARKDSENPAFKRDGKASTYADLASVIDACRKPLADNGLAFVQTNANDAHGVTVTTTLLHASGEQISSPFWVPIGTSTAQGYGAASTYARRFGLSALLGVAADDDDGNEASQRGGPMHDAANALREKARLEAIAQRQAGIAKMISAYAAIGVDQAELESKLGHSILQITDDEWTQMRKAYEEHKAAKADPDEAARLEVSRQAEAALEAEKKKATVPQTQAQTEQALKNSIFQAAVDRIRRALTEADVLMIGATFATLGLSESDLKALRRVYSDRLLVMQDGMKESKKKKLAVKDEVP